MSRVTGFLDRAFGSDRRAVRVALGLSVFWVFVFGAIAVLDGNDQELSQADKDRILDRVREGLCRDGTASPDLCLEWQKERE